MGQVPGSLIAPLATARFLLVIPVYKPGPPFFEFLPRLCSALARSALRFRVQVVNDGCDDEASSLIEAAVERAGATGVRLSPVLSLARNSGKGAAVYAGWHTGWEESWLGFVDCDGSIPPEEVIRLAQLADEGGQLAAVVASRQPVPGRVVVRKSHRHWMGRCFASAVTVGLKLPIHDTQCGLKWVPKEAFRAVTSGLTEARFVFDVDLLAALQRHGCQLREEPISWADSGHSTVRLWRDIPAMGFGLLRLVLKYRLGLGQPAGS